MQPVVAKFKALIMTKVKSNLAGIIKENQINILEIDQNLDLISDKLKDSINEVLNEYGLVMPEFFVTAIMTPDDDPNYKRLKQQHADLYLKVRQEQILKAEAEASAERKMVEAQTEARMKVISAQGEAEAYRLKAAAEAEEMRMKGYTYQQETARQIGMGAVENMGNIGSGSGGGSILGGIGDLAGLGISLGAMGGIMNMTRDAVNPLLNSTAAVGSELTDTISGAVRSGTASASAPAPVPVQTWSCPQCHTENTGKFCSNCAAPRPAPAPEPVQTWSCPQCHTENTGNFCSNCGKKKGELNDGEIQ